MDQELYDILNQELTPVEWNELEEASLHAPKRYAYYRRKHPDKSLRWCLDAAVAWARNTIEQHERRKRHETGAL